MHVTHDFVSEALIPISQAIKNRIAWYSNDYKLAYADDTVILADSLEAVSYTHLDVYKRQHYNDMYRSI